MKSLTPRGIFYSILLIAPFVVPLLVVGCGDGPVDPPPPPQIVNGTEYFPMGDEDTWFYNSASVIRTVDGDTTINGYVCKRVFQGTKTTQAWSLTTERFAQHLLDRSVTFNPPLEIPLDLVKGAPHAFNSLGIVDPSYNPGDIDSVRTFGSLTFDGYVTRTINQVDLDSCIKIDYDYIDSVFFSDGVVIAPVTQYSEYYARGIGLIDDGDLVLDQARINGVMVP